MSTTDLPPMAGGEDAAAALPLRAIDQYGSLGFLVSQEVPYDLVEPHVQFLNLRTQDEFPPVAPGPESPTSPEINDAQAQALNAQFAPDNKIQRFGWLGDASRYEVPPIGRP